MQYRALKYKDRRAFFIKEETLDAAQNPDSSFVVASSKILVKVHSAALNPIDVMLKNAATPYLFSADKGFGLDYSGDVVGIGKDAAAKTGLKVGSKVCGMNQHIFGPGTVSDYTLVDPFVKSGASIQPIPPNITYQEAAAYPLVLGTAESMCSGIHPENAKKKFLVLGAGTTLGKLVIQLAKNVYGATEVVATCSPNSENLVRELGADSIIDYTKVKSILLPVLESVAESGRFDVILDCCGNGDLFPEIHNVLQSREEFGFYTSIIGDVKPKFTESYFTSMFHQVFGGLRALRSSLGFLCFYYTMTMIDGSKPWPPKCAQYVADGKVKIAIDSEYSFEDYQKAVDRITSNKAAGKVIINL